MNVYLKGMTDAESPFVNFPSDFASKASYFSNNDTYDMTNLASGIYIDILHSAEKMLNFSAKLYLRKDRKWGMPRKLANGSIILQGMLKSVVEGPADFIWGSFGMLPARYPYVDFLPPFNEGAIQT